MDFNLDAFWLRFQHLIRQNGYTQRTLSTALGLSPRSVETWKTQRQIPDAAQLCKLADLLGTSVEYLVTGKETDLPQELPLFRWLSPERQSAIKQFYDFQVQTQEAESKEDSESSTA